jgi:hypothetical protein
MLLPKYIRRLCNAIGLDAVVLILVGLLTGRWDLLSPIARYVLNVLWRWFHRIRKWV